MAVLCNDFSTCKCRLLREFVKVSSIRYAFLLYFQLKLLDYIFLLMPIWSNRFIPDTVFLLVSLTFVQAEYRLVRKCITGHIYDSGPVDFTSDLGTQYGLHPAILKMPGSSKLVSWLAKGIASGLDALYLTRFESQCAEYWQALFSSVVSSYLAFTHLLLFVVCFC